MKQTEPEIQASLDRATEQLRAVCRNYQQFYVQQVQKFDRMYAAVRSCRYTWAEYFAAVQLENEALTCYRTHRESTPIAPPDWMDVQTFAASALHRESLTMHEDVVLQCAKRAVETRRDIETRAEADRQYELLVCHFTSLLINHPRS
eukprot:3152495-Pleurochrysis_carterae.AAC.1